MHMLVCPFAVIINIQMHMLVWPFDFYYYKKHFYLLIYLFIGPWFECLTGLQRLKNHLNQISEHSKYTFKLVDKEMFLSYVGFEYLPNVKSEVRGSVI